MSTTRACASGCTIRDEHLTDCGNDECRGCLPRQTEHGELCGRCWTSLATNLAGVPHVIAHLREIARLEQQPSAKPLTTDPVHRGDPAHGTVLPAAWLAADELWSLVTGWAQVVLEEHPMGLRGPNARPWHGDVVAWLVPHLEWVARQDWAPDFRRELARDVATLRARWPLPDDVERDRGVPDVRCPRCDAVALRFYPPQHFRQPFAVACGDCGRTFDEAGWERFVASYQRAEVRAALTGERMSA